MSLRQRWVGKSIAIILSFVMVAASMLGALPGTSVAAMPAQSFNEMAAKSIALLQGSYSAIPDNPYGAGWWNAANILETTIDYMQRSGSRAYLPIVEKTFKESKEAHRKNFINEYYDDEGWWAITWIKAYDLTGDSKYLDMAKIIFADMITGWDDTANGGIWWSKDRNYKNAIPNELFLEIAARLHNRIPGDVVYLEWANKEWEWFKNSGMINESKLINDGLRFDPESNQYVNNDGITWTYNQGVILGGLVALSEANHDPSLLDEAIKIADAVIASSELNVDGILTEPCETLAQGCDGDQTQFKGIFMKNLKVLYDKVGDPRYQEFMLDNARSVWANSQNDLGQFGVNWSGPFDRSNASIQASAIDVFNTQVVAGLPLTNLALGRQAWTTGGTCSNSEGAANVADGNLDTKWCMAAGTQTSVTIDLWSAQPVSQFVIYHAGSNKENANLNANLNTMDFDILTSVDNINWATQVEVRGNLSNVTTHDIPPVVARYVKLHVLKSQSSPQYTATRVNEIMVNGLASVSSGLLLDRSAVMVKEGETAQITANASSGVIWSSDNTTVATVDANGKVIAHARGTATITAKASDGSTATCVITVLENTPPVGGEGAGFYTGFEKAEPQPTWINTVEAKQNVGGSTADLRDMETKVVNYSGQTNNGYGNVLYYSGKANGPAGTDSYSYNRVFSTNIPVTDTVKTLDYWIKPTEANGTYARVDLAFNDGSYLHELNGDDFQSPLNPGEWNYVQLDLGAAVGKTIQRILVSYSRHTSAGEQAPGLFSGYIDDIRIGDSAALHSLVPSTDPSIEYVGRWDKSSQHIPVGYWGGTYFRTGFTGTTVKLILPARTRMYVSIDNGPEVLYDSAYGIVNLTPNPLSEGDHELRVTTSWMDQTLELQGLLLDPGATVKSPPERAKLVEFIGDSITAGVVTNAVSDYAYLTGEKLNVNHTQVAFSGICLVECGRSTSPGGMIKQYFKRNPIFNAADTAPDWDFSQYAADAVVVNLGTNDNGEKIDPGTFQRTYVALLSGIRDKFPNAQILALRTFNGYYDSQSKAAVEERAAAGDTKVQYVDTTGWVDAGTPDYMDVYHPSDLGHYKITQRLAPILREALALAPEPEPESDSSIVWATDYSEKNGNVDKRVDPSVGTFIATNAAGNWVKYEGVDFGDGSYDTFMANIAAWSTGHKIEIYKDSIDPVNKLGELTTAATGNWDIFKEQYGSVASVSGVHDIYLKFPTEYAANVNWFIFAKGVPANETQEEIDQRMQWFDEARFGQFIHWGAYSVLAGSYNGQTVGYAEWIMDNLKISKDDYRNAASKKFDPNLFDAKKWVDLAKQAGQKYIIITSKHHEGYSMFDTEVGDFKPYGVVSMSPSHIDPMAALAKESKEQGIKFGFYYSIMDWMHPLSPRDGNTFYPEDQVKKDKYVSQMKGQLRELIEKYDPDVLWFDGEWNAWWTKADGQALYKYLRTLKNDLIINNRIGKREADDGDFGTPEQEVPATGLDYRWESCITINNTWGFSATDHDWKSTTALIHMLVETASKGGNLLLNIGPTAAGVTPQESVDRLHEMGDWLSVYGESIYGTKASVFPEKLPWGYSTTKDGKVYLHVTEWSANGQLILPKLTNTLNRIYMLNEKDSMLEYRTVKDYLVIDLPETVNGKAPNAVDEVIVLDVAGEPTAAEQPAMNNLAAGKLASSNSVYDAAHSPNLAVDSNDNTRWASKDDGMTPVWLEINFGEKTTFNKVIAHEFLARTGDFKIQYWDGSRWRDAYSGYGIGSSKTFIFPSVTGTKARLYITSLSPQDQNGPSFYEFRIYQDTHSIMPPIITLNGNRVMDLVVRDIFKDPGAAALDASGEDISSAIIAQGTVDTTKPGTYSITYDVSDADGVKSERVTRTVNVRPNAVTAAGGAEIVTVTNLIQGATLKLYNKSNALVAAKVATTDTVQFKSAPAGGKDFYVTQTVNGLESAPSNKVDIQAYNPPEALKAVGGIEEVTIQNAVAGATLELYNGANEFVASKLAETAGVLKFTSVPAGQGYYVIQTVDGIVGVPSNKVTVSARSTGGPFIPVEPEGGTKEPGTDADPSRWTLPVPEADTEGLAVSNVDGSKLKERLKAIAPNGEGVKRLEIIIPQADRAKSYTIVIPSEYVSGEKAAYVLDVETPVGKFGIPSNMFKPDQLKGVQSVAFQAGVREGAAELKVNADGKPIDWVRSAVPVAMKLPYPLTAEERQGYEYMSVAYKDRNGGLVTIPSAKYDPATGEVSFNAPVSGTFHISFARKTFDDLGKHGWAKQAIEVMASKGIIKGTSPNRFTPGEAITRADFLLLLVTTLELIGESASSFSDVSQNAYYYKAVSIASELGIANGIGNGQFAPTAPISRQDMMAMIARAMEAAKKPLKKGTASDIASFADRDRIADYAMDGVASLIKDGIIIGDGSNINPKGKTTRAEGAMLMYRLYLKL